MMDGVVSAVVIDGPDKGKGFLMNSEFLETGYGRYRLVPGDHGGYCLKHVEDDPRNREIRRLAKARQIVEETRGMALHERVLIAHKHRPYSVERFNFRHNGKIISVWPDGRAYYMSELGVFSSIPGIKAKDSLGSRQTAVNAGISYRSALRFSAKQKFGGEK